MKKIFVAAAILSMFAAVSCGSNNEKKAEEEAAKVEAAATEAEATLKDDLKAIGEDAAKEAAQAGADAAVDALKDALNK